MSKWKSGQSFELQSLVGKESILQRLRELGFVTGSQVKIISKSLFGDPIIFEVNGTTVALRKEEAECLQVK